MAYDEWFFDGIATDSAIGARVIMPIILGHYNPESLVDVGCGEGVWLEVASKLKPQLKVIGIDGPYVNRDRLRIPRDCFYGHDLEAGIPSHAPTVYDLALCIETAEHLTPSAGDKLVEWLCCSAKTVIFSAAIPGQVGVNHLSENWPSFWIEKFFRHGYLADSWLRAILWQNQEISYCYRQNFFVFSQDNPKNPYFLHDAIHPELWTGRREGRW